MCYDVQATLYSASLIGLQGIGYALTLNTKRDCQHYPKHASLAKSTKHIMMLPLTYKELISIPMKKAEGEGEGLISKEG